MSEFISSPANRLIKEVVSLKQKKYRDSLGLFIAEGVRLIEECAVAGWSVATCIYTEAAAARDRTRSLIERLERLNCQLAVVPDSLYNKISDTEQPQGIMVIVKKRQATLESMVAAGENPPLVVVLDGIQDPGNVGTIIRTADAAGCTGVIALKGSADIYAGKTVRASMGSLFHLPVVEGITSLELISWLQRCGVRLLATSLQQSEPYYRTRLTSPVAIVLGNEGQGVSPELLEAADSCVNIPLIGQAESLNVAVAAGIILYEAVRQRSTL